MSQVTNRYTTAQINQLVSDSLAEDGAICNYLKKEYDEQATYNNGEGARKIFQNLNEKIKLYHIFLRNLIGEDRVDINEAIPVIDFQNTKNTSFLKTYAVQDNQVDSTTILDLSTLPPVDPWTFRNEEPYYQINHAIAGDQESEYFYNTRSFVSSQYNIQTSPVTSEHWAYLGVRTQIAVINDIVTSADKLQKDPIYYYQHTELEETKLVLTMDDLKNGNSEIQIPMQNFYGSNTVKAFKNGGTWDKNIILLYPGDLGEDGQRNGQSPADFKLPYCSSYSDTEHKLGSVVSNSDNNTRVTFPLQRGDIVFFIPDYTLKLTCRYKVLIFKQIQTALIPESEEGTVSVPILKYKDTDILQYLTNEAAVSTIPGWTGNFLVFLTYTNDYKTFFNLIQVNAESIVDETLDSFFGVNYPFFESIIKLNKWYFGESSGLLNGLYSIPFEYDTTLTDYNAPVNDELRHPKVIKWKFANDLEEAMAHGQNIEKGTRYYPGHILNRGTIISAPLRRSEKDPVGKLTDINGKVDFVYKSSEDYLNNITKENYSPYYGKIEIFYDLLNNVDFSNKLFAEFVTRQTPEVLFESVGSVRTQEWFIPSTMTYAHRLQLEKTNSLGLTTKVPFTAEDIIGYLDKFKAMFQSGIVNNHNTLCIDQNSDEDPALYHTVKILEPYQRVSGNTTKTVYVDNKNGRQHDSDAKGRTRVDGIFDALTYEEVAQTSSIIRNHSITEVLQNPEKSVFISYKNQYPGDYHQRGLAPEIYETNENGEPQTNSPTSFVTPVYLNRSIPESNFNGNTSGSTDNIAEASCAYARECSVRVLTPMDVFGALTGQSEIANHFIVYPAKKDQFPESLFLFSKTAISLPLEEIIEDGKGTGKFKNNLITLWTHDPDHPGQNEKFILFRVADSWDYNYKTDCKYVQLTSPETENWRLVRKSKWFELEELWPETEQNYEAAEQELRKYPDYANITYQKKAYTKDIVSEMYAKLNRYGVKVPAALDRTTTVTEYHYTLSYPKSSTDSTNIDLDLEANGIDLLLFKTLCEKLKIEISATDKITECFRNLEFLSNLDPGELEIFSNLGIEHFSVNFTNLLIDLKNWAIAKKNFDNWNAKYNKLKNDLNEESQNQLTQEFHCYLLQPLVFDFEKIFNETTQVYAQELSNTDQNEPANILGGQNLIKLLPISSPSNYFHISQEQVEDGIYARTGVSKADINNDLKSLENAQICLYAPAFSEDKPAAYFSQHGVDVFKALGSYFNEALSNSKSGIRALTARITTEFLKKFQLSVVNDDPQLTPIMLTELPEVLRGLQAMEKPLKMLAASGVQIPLSESDVSSYAKDSQANLGDLNKLLNRFENDIIYYSNSFKINVNPNLQVLDWKEVPLTVDAGKKEITYAVYSNAQSPTVVTSGFTHLTAAEYSLFGHLPSSSSKYNFVELYQSLQDPTSIIEDIADKATYTSLFNKLFHLVFKTRLQALLTVDQETPQRKVLRSFKYLEQTFAEALDNAEVNGFDQQLCRLLDLHFGDGTRPFFNLESRSCSYSVDEQVLGLKKTYLEQTAQQCYQLLNSLQTEALDQASLLDNLWDLCFGSSSEVRQKYRLGSYKVKANAQVPIAFDKIYSAAESTDSSTLIAIEKRKTAQSIKQSILAIQPNYTAGAPVRSTRFFFVKKVGNPYRINALSEADLFKYLRYWQNFEIIDNTEATAAKEFRTSVNSNSAVSKDWSAFYAEVKKITVNYYNNLITEIFTKQTQKLITEKDISDYLGGESFGTDPGQVTFFDKVTYTSDGNNKLSYFTYDGSKYTKVETPQVGVTYYVPKWAYYNGTYGINNYYYIPQYRDNMDDSSNIIISPRYAAVNNIDEEGNIKGRIYGAENDAYQITLNLNLPDVSFNSDLGKYLLNTPATLVSDLAGIDPDSLTPEIAQTLDILSPSHTGNWTEAETTDSTAVYQTVLPVPAGNQNDASEAMLMAIVDIARKAITGKGTDKILPGTPVKMLETDTEPSGDPTGLYFKRYQALNTRMNRLNGPLASAGRYLRNQSALVSLNDVEEQAIETYKNLMTVVPIAQMAEIAYMPTQLATASTIPLDGKFYYTAEMTQLRQQISDKCVLTCHSCPVKDNCIFYNEEEILKLYCTPAQYIDLYFKDNELDLLYYDEDPDQYSPDIYEYEEVINPETEKLEKCRIGESIGHEYFQALHKPYSEILMKYQGKTLTKVAENRPIRKDVDSDYFVMPSIETEFHNSPKIAWNENLDGNLSWLTNARYGTVEVNDAVSLLEKNYPALRSSLRPYKYLYNAVYVFDEETEFDYSPSANFYNIDDFYIFDKEGNPHRYGGRTRIKLPTSLKAFMEARNSDDVYLISDDTRDSNNNEIVPVIYLDTIGNLRKPGRTTFNINTTSTEGIKIAGDRAVYAQDIANWCVRYAKNHNANEPASGVEPLGSHRSLAENRDQYWMEYLSKQVKNNKGVLETITVPGRPRIASGYQEPLLDPENPNEAAIISGKPGTANYINFVRRFSIKLCDVDPTDISKVHWRIKWIKGLDNPETDDEKKQIEEKRRILPLMKTNLRLVIVKNN